MKNKIIAALLTLSMLLSQCLIMPTFAASDYEGHWAEEHIDKLITAGIVAGDENGKINPDNSIKRSEFVKIVNRKFNFTNAGTENFPDVSADAWYAKEFKIAKAQGYLTGDDKGNANPDNPITRAEVSVIIARVLKLNDDYSSVKPFSDDSDIPSWAKESVYRLNLKGYINGYPDGSFKAQNTITRAESFTIIAKITTTSSTPTIPSGGGFGGGSSGGGGGGSSSGGSSGGSSSGGGGGGSSSGGNSGGNTEKEPENKDRTPEELKELNDNKEPEIESREDSDIGLYTGVYSEVKVDDVDDAIDSLENVKTLLNIGDVEDEFVPFDDEDSKIDENTYKIQQVYNGVPVANAQTIISVNEEGYPDSILNRYDDSIRLSGINATPSISEARAKEIILADLISKDAEYTNGNVESIYLEIQADQKILTYHAYVTCDNSLGFNYYVDAHSGEVIVANAITPDFAYNPSGVSNSAKMWGLSTDIFYDTALQKYVFYNNNRNISVYDMQQATYDWDKHEPILNKKVIPYDNIIAVLPDAEQTQLSNGQPLNGSDNYTVDGFYAVRNFEKTISTFKNNYLLIYDQGTKMDVSINILGLEGNAAALTSDSQTKHFKSVFGTGEVRQLDTVGHEFTHLYQAYHISSTKHKGMQDSLGDGCGKSISGNLKWVEAMAISEGTADIMGMLIEAINGEVDFKSNDFWKFGEDINNANQQEDHYDIIVNGNKNEIRNHTTVHEMNNFYNSEAYIYFDEDDNGTFETPYKRNELPYMKGPGHSDRYILINAFMKMISKISSLSSSKRDVFKANNDDAVLWFKLWGHSLPKLTSSSSFADMRLALLDTANDMRMSQEEYNAINEALSEVGITSGHFASATNELWYAPYVRIAEANSVITPVQGSYLTRAELLKMVIRRCDIYVGNINDESYYLHSAGQYVQLAYNYGAVNMQWLKSAAQEPDDSNSFLNQNIPRWEAMHLMYKLMNASEVHHEKTRVYGYSLSGNSEWNYAKFKNTFKDFGECVPDTNRDNIVNLLNMHRGYFESNKNGSLTLTPTSEIEVKLNADGTYNSADWNKKVYGKDGGLETFLTEHGALADANIDKNYMSTNTCSEYTYSMLYYFGMYQLWVNGKFSGQSVNGEKMLKATDPITIGEACAILYK